MQNMSDNAIFIRRSIRSYLPCEVEREKIENIVRAGMQAPTALDGRCWAVYVYTGETEKKLIAGMSPHASMAGDAAAVCVLCADMEAVRREREEAWWIQGLSACAQNMLLQIVHEGLGGVWLGCYPRQARVDYLIEKLHLPAEIIPFAVIPFGYSDERNVFEDHCEPEKMHIL